MKPVQLAFLPAAGEDWRVVNVVGAPPKSPRCVLVVPGAGVLARDVEAVGVTEAQARAAALAVLASDLAAPLDECVCALGPVRGGRRAAFVASRRDVAGWLGAARTRGLNPDAVLPDFALLPAPENGEAVVARNGEDVAVRTPDAAFGCQADLLATLLGAKRPAEFELVSEAVRSVRAGAAPSAPNLAIAMPTRAPAAGGATFLRAGIAAAAALLVFAVAPWVEVFRLDASTASLRREAEAIARTALPQGTRIVNPVAQLREAALPMQRLESQINLTAGLYEGLARSPGVELGRIQADEDGAILADLTTSDAKLLQPLRDHLAAEGVSLEEVPGAGAPNRLVFSITLRGQP